MALIALLLAAAAPAVPPVPARVTRLLERAPIIDGHNDLAWEIRERHEARVEALDLSRNTAALPYPLQTDVPRLRRGGVGGQFWSVWIPADTTGPRAVEMTLEQIDIVRRFVAAKPAAFALATSATDIREAQRAGRIASLIGIEGGHQIDGRLSVLRQMKALGVGYMTLTHGKSLAWADSSTDAPRANGLTAFGRQVVAEMNRIGMIVDVSHVSDATLAAVLDVAAAPVIASHSSARALADAPRNIPDDLLRRIGTAGGVVMVNVYPAFLSSAWRAWDRERTAFGKANGLATDAYGPKAPAPLVAWDAAHPMPRVTAATLADHVEHIARVAGRGAVGIGGDYDGIGGTAPEDMAGVDGYPRLFAELARRGWSDVDLAAMAQGNVLRVIERVEAVAASQKGRPPIDATAPN
ncbi:membrane dipeptidase [Sphingomonas sp. NBWT7]|uniref:dipeptidase n=1 Tax=Sphingomonas sp. NBWT7 TaxID=2596913 RepID=UPI0016289F13|nr:dipeptidase [Sphingomonas sp. NBWT7]QNE32014.1 membrane dipeptidase [Sphingomonas sp. NBWT7]